MDRPPPPPAAPRAPDCVLGIMEAGGLFSLGLDGPDADAVYARLAADDLAWPLHATWKVRSCAESARRAVLVALAAGLVGPAAGG